jgi:hypothetical protein
VNLPVVTVCIPTWQSEGFIDKTLRYARDQTYPHLRIAVSIDLSDDRTEEICRRHADEDSRVTVLAHRSRLGWARNVNFLLERVTSEYFFIYLHDDILDARYVETLLTVLAAHPDAASAQCDVLHVQPDGTQGLNPGATQEGPTSRRILASLVGTHGGEPLRSLIRSSAVGESLRLAETSARGFEAHQPFQLRLFAAGPALHVPETLYWRWSSRKGGLVDSWTTTSIETVVADLRANAVDSLGVIDGSDTAEFEKTAMRFGLYVNQMIRLRDHELGQRARALVDPRDVSPAYTYAGIPAAVADLPRDVREWVVSGYVNLIRKEALLHARVRNLRSARARLRTVRAGDAVMGVPVLAKRRASRVLRRLRPIELPADLHDRLASP